MTARCYAARWIEWTRENRNYILSTQLTRSTLVRFTLQNYSSSTKTCPASRRELSSCYLQPNQAILSRA